MLFIISWNHFTESSPKKCAILAKNSPKNCQKCTFWIRKQLWFAFFNFWHRVTVKEISTKKLKNDPPPKKQNKNGVHLLSRETMLSRNDFFIPSSQYYVLGAYSRPKWPKIAPREHPQKGIFFFKKWPKSAKKCHRSTFSKSGWICQNEYWIEYLFGQSLIELSTSIEHPYLRPN